MQNIKTQIGYRCTPYDSLIVFIFYLTIIYRMSLLWDTIVGTSNYASNKTDTITDLMGLRLNFLL